MTAFARTSFVLDGSMTAFSRTSFVLENAVIEPVVKVQLLGVTLDSDLTMGSHVSKTVSSSFHHLRRLKSIRRSLPHDVIRH